MVLPQPSPAWPHWMPCCWQVIAVHAGAPHWYATPPPPQVLLPVQPPQKSRLPQPSGMEPHVAPLAAHVVGVHCAPPHWLATPAPPQVWPLGHGKQSGVRPPQPSLCSPHVPAGYAEQVFGVHVGTVHVPRVEPGGFTQPPVQQSDEVVHDPLVATQDAWQWYLLSDVENTHGLPQQSALVAQTVPTGGGVVQVPT